MKTNYTLLALLLTITILFAGCCCDSNTANNTNEPNVNEPDNPDNPDNPTDNDWKDNGEGTGNYYTHFITTQNNNTERYTTKQTTKPFLENPTNMQDMIYSNGVKYIVSDSSTLPEAKETDFYDKYENIAFIEYTAILYTLLKPYNNAPYKTTWNDGTITYTVKPFLYVNYKYNAEHDWMYGTCTTGFAPNDYVGEGDLTSYRNFKFCNIMPDEYHVSPENYAFEQGSYTIIYLPPDANDQNDLIYVTQTTTPTEETLYEIFGEQELTLFKSKEGNNFILLPIIYGNPPNTTTNATNNSIDINTTPRENDGVINN
ncbi:MAG: hypothetical protein LBP59_10890 [Planctomycetaceae bacterium]|jgi:hypothetical protein|nr:hypothetical protein [Planctomycetaceae bacterium]